MPIQPADGSQCAQLARCEKIAFGTRRTDIRRQIHWIHAIKSQQDDVQIAAPGVIDLSCFYAGYCGR